MTLKYNGLCREIERTCGISNTQRYMKTFNAVDDEFRVFPFLGQYIYSVIFNNDIIYRCILLRSYKCIK